MSIDDMVDADAAPRQPRRVEAADDSRLRPALEAVLMVADQPLDHLTLAQAVGAPPERRRAALAELAAEYTEQGRGFDLREVGAGWRFYTREEFADVVEQFVVDGPAGPADPGRARDARRRRLPAAGQPGAGVGDPRRQRRRRDAHAGVARPRRGGRRRARDRRPPVPDHAATSSSGWG